MNNTSYKKRNTKNSEKKAPGKKSRVTKPKLQRNRFRKQVNKNLMKNIFDRKEVLQTLLQKKKDFNELLSSSDVVGSSMEDCGSSPFRYKLFSNSTSDPKVFILL